MYTLEEIKKQVFENVKDDKDLDILKCDFYVYQGATILCLIYKGVAMSIVQDVISDYEPYSYKQSIPVTTVNMDVVGAEAAMKAVNDYSASFAAIDAAWDEIIREATIEKKKAELGRMGYEAILKAAFDGKQVYYEVSDTDEETGLMKVWVCTGKNWSKEPELTVWLDPACQDNARIVQQIAQFAIGISEMKEANNEYIDCVKVEDVFSLEFDKNDDRMKKLSALVSEVNEYGHRMDLQLAPNTLEQIAEVLQSAGIKAKVVDSPYNHTMKMVKVLLGVEAMPVIITADKMPGMLVAKSPFLNNSSNVCVSHRPLEQVKNWFLMIQEKLVPEVAPFMLLFRSWQASRNKLVEKSWINIQGRFDVNYFKSNILNEPSMKAEAALNEIYKLITK